MTTAQFGIYYGGSSMSIAYSRDDKHSIVVNEAGYRSTPSVLALSDQEFLVGVPAKQNLIRNSRNSILFAKHFINATSDAIIQRLDCQVNVDSENNKTGFVVEDKEISVCDAIQRQLHYLNELGKSSLGVKECNAVLSVPFHFSTSQSDFLRDCAQKAGFQVLRVVKNPVAACLGYDLEEDDASDLNCLVYQMGGNSLELSLVSISNGLMRVLDSTHLPGIGGDLFTSVVIDILCEEFQRKHKADPRENKRSMFKLKSNAEELKHILSTMERAHCSIDALYDGIDFDFYLTRQRFESGCTKLYQQILQPVDDLLRANGLTETQIDRVIVCGAATKMCKLQSLLGQKFETQKLLNYQSPDEVIAVGCAKQCALMTNSKRQAPLQTGDSVFKCLSSPIYYKIGSGDKVLLLKEKLPLPIKRSVNFEFNQPLLTIMENDRDLVKIDLKSFKSKEASLLIQIKMNETIEITVSETNTNERITLFLNSETNAEL